MIGYVDHLERLNWIVSRNDIRLEPLKRRGIYDKCWKKVVKSAEIFCGKFCVGRGQDPPCQRVWCVGCYVEHTKDDLLKSGKEYGGDWEGELEGRHEKGKTGNHMLMHFQCDLCHFQNMKRRDPTDMS